MRGAVALENSWLKTDTLKDVAVYVVWSPQLGASEKFVKEATRLIPDPRATHYWDAQMLAGFAYQPVVKSKAAAWDTWLLFDKNAMWRGDSVPRPAWWEHQMSAGPPDRRLNPIRWTSHAIALHTTKANQ